MERNRIYSGYPRCSRNYSRTDGTNQKKVSFKHAGQIRKLTNILIRGLKEVFA